MKLQWKEQGADKDFQMNMVRGKGQVTCRVCYLSDVSDPGSFGRHGDVAYIGSSEGLYR